MTEAIDQRKRDHLKLARDPGNQFNQSAGFENWRLRHNALPEISLDEVDTCISFLGKQLQFPFIISSMSGGVAEATELNRNLAEAARETGCALGLGSIRPVLENPQRAESFRIARKTAPEAVILANLGLAQLIAGMDMETVAKCCRELGVDGLIIHVNPMQEAIQPEGEANFKRGLPVIHDWVKAFPLPILVKEVGHGLSPDVVFRLREAGVDWIDVAGAGGTSWTRIETQRLPANSVERRVAAEFGEWGEPTAAILASLPPDMPHLIASGGLKRPMDLALAIALGASMGASARSMLTLAQEGSATALIDELSVWQQTLRLAMFGTGQRNLVNFRGNRDLLEQRCQEN